MGKGLSIKLRRTFYFFKILAVLLTTVSLVENIAFYVQDFQRSNNRIFPGGSEGHEMVKKKLRSHCIQIQVSLNRQEFEAGPLRGGRGR